MSFAENARNAEDVLERVGSGLAAEIVSSLKEMDANYFWSLVEEDANGSPLRFALVASLSGEEPILFVSTSASSRGEIADDGPALDRAMYEMALGPYSR